MMPTNVERLIATAQALPAPLLAEVLDFAEFLRARQPLASAATPGLSLLDLRGGLQGLEAFEGDPVDIQRALRDEWS